MEEALDNLGQVFEYQSVMFIRHEALMDPLLSLVEKTEGSFICFRFQEIFLEKNILPGDAVSCHVLRDGFEYSAQGVIADIQLQSPHLVQVRVEKLNRFPNQRAYSRYPVNFQAEYFPNGDGQKHYGLIRNVSITGASLITKEEMEKGTLLSVQTLTFISMDQLLKFRARIARAAVSPQYFEYGLEITEIDEENKNLLEMVLFYLNSNEEIFIEGLKTPEPAVGEE